jgi:hypothetical protein
MRNYSSQDFDAIAAQLNGSHRADLRRCQAVHRLAASYGPARGGRDHDARVHDLPCTHKDRSVWHQRPWLPPN